MPCLWIRLVGLIPITVVQYGVMGAGEGEEEKGEEGEGEDACLLWEPVSGLKAYHCGIAWRKGGQMRKGVPCFWAQPVSWQPEREEKQRGTEGGQKGWGTLLLSPSSWLEAHDSGVAASVVLQQAGHALQRDRPQRYGMHVSLLVVAGQQRCSLSWQLYALQHLPLGHTHIHLHASPLWDNHTSVLCYQLCVSMRCEEST